MEVRDPTTSPTTSTSSTPTSGHAPERPDFRLLRPHDHAGQRPRPPAHQGRAEETTISWASGTARAPREVRREPRAAQAAIAHEHGISVANFHVTSSTSGGIDGEPGAVPEASAVRRPLTPTRTRMWSWIAVRPRRLGPSTSTSAYVRPGVGSPGSSIRTKHRGVGGLHARERRSGGASVHAPPPHGARTERSTRLAGAGPRLPGRLRRDDPAHLDHAIGCQWMTRGAVSLTEAPGMTVAVLPSTEPLRPCLRLPSYTRRSCSTTTASPVAGAARPRNRVPCGFGRRSS